MRVPMQIPVALVTENGARQRKALTTDISQGGMSLKVSRRAQDSGPMRIKFTLPGTDHSIECAAEVAWEGDGSQAGIRFANLSSEQRDHLKVWLAQHAPEMEIDDPPAPCKLTDLSSGGCYLEIAAPFPMNTLRVILIMRLKKLESRVEGVVRVMHPEVGMGVEFTRTTNQQRKHLEEFIHALKNHKGAQPELVVEPEGMNDAEVSTPASALDDIDDPLLELFQRNTDFTAESFLSELRKQRNSPPLEAQAAASGSL